MQRQGADREFHRAAGVQTMTNHRLGGGDGQSVQMLAEHLAKAEMQIASTRDQAMSNVRQIALETAGAIVEKLTGAAPTAAQLSAAQARGDA